MCFNSGVREEMQAANAEARAANALARKESEEARKRAAAAMVSPADSESGRQAAETRMRRLLGLTPPQLTNLGPAPVGYKILTGQ